MKLGLLGVLAVAVLVPSLSESRIVSKCELKDQLSKAIKLPARLEKHRETILERVIYSIYSKSRLNTSLVRVFGKRITTTAKPTTEATTPSTSGGNETTTEEMTGPTDVQPAANESVTINPMTTNSGNGTNSTDGSRRKREASSGVEESAEVTVNEEDNIEDDEYQISDMDEGNEDEYQISDMDEGNEDEGEGSEEGGEGDDEEEEVNEEEEEVSDEEEEEVSEEEEEVSDEAEEEVNEEEEGVDEEEEGVDEEEEIDEEEEEVNQEEEEVMDNNEGGKREKRSFRRRKPKQKQGLKPNKQQGPKPKLSLKKKWALKLRPLSIGFYGLFQLSDSYFCDSGYRWSRNRCQTSCTAFTDDDISDDIACFVKTRRWWFLVRKARWYKPAKGFLEECN